MFKKQKREQTQQAEEIMESLKQLLKDNLLEELRSAYVKGVLDEGHLNFLINAPKKMSEHDKIVMNATGIDSLVVAVNNLFSGSKGLHLAVDMNIESLTDLNRTVEALTEHNELLIKRVDSLESKVNQ